MHNTKDTATTPQALNLCRSQRAGLRLAWCRRQKNIFKWTRLSVSFHLPQPRLYLPFPSTKNVEEHLLMRKIQTPFVSLCEFVFSLTIQPNKRKSFTLGIFHERKTDFLHFHVNILYGSHWVIRYFSGVKSSSGCVLWLDVGSLCCL